MKKVYLHHFIKTCLLGAFMINLGACSKSLDTKKTEITPYTYIYKGKIDTQNEIKAYIDLTDTLYMKQYVLDNFLDTKKVLDGNIKIDIRNSTIFYRSSDIVIGALSKDYEQLTFNKSYLFPNSFILNAWEVR